MQYTYTLPEDDEEVIVSGVAMAIVDLAKHSPLPDARAIQERALYHCEMTHRHIRGDVLTNDDEGFKHLFIASYAAIYEREPPELLRAVRDIIHRHPIGVALAGIRTIVQGIYFPNRADLERLKMEYEGVLLTVHRSVDGYYATFIYNDAVQRTPDMGTPVLALAQAQRMIDRVKTT